MFLTLISMDSNSMPNMQDLLAVLIKGFLYIFKILMFIHWCCKFSCLSFAFFRNFKEWWELLLFSVSFINSKKKNWVIMQLGYSICQKAHSTYFYMISCYHYELYNNSTFLIGSLRKFDFHIGLGLPNFQTSTAVRRQTLIHCFKN